MLHNYNKHKSNIRKAFVFSAFLFGASAMAQDCGLPQGLITTQGTAHTAVNFTAPSTTPSLGYDWEIKVTGSENLLQGGTTNGTHFLVLNLEPETDYVLRIRSHCTEDTYGDWVTQNITTNSMFSQFNAQVGIGTGQDLTLYGPLLYVGVITRKGSVANMLYSAEELNALQIPTGAQITKVAFNKVSNATNAVAPYTPVRMRVLAANSTTVAPVSTTQTLADVEASHTEVMDNDAFTIPAEIGWVDFNFEAPFTYTGDALEIATVFYQTMDTPQFSSFVAWQFTSGYRDYVAGAWPLPSIDMNAPETIILSHNSGGGQYKDRPNMKIFYQISNAVEDINVTTLNDVPAEITESHDSLQLVSAIAPANASQQVIWEIVSGSEFATIYQNGVVSAFADGTVVVRVTSADDETLFEEITIGVTNQLPCEIAFPDNVEPITSVKFAGINNQSSAVIGAATPAQEDFTAISGQVSLGAAYSIEVKGNTNGNFTHHVTAYIDWNRNNSFEDEGETYTVGTLQNSTGTDDVTATTTIIIPADVALGNTKMRVIKKFNAIAPPCNTTGYGQAEDYSITINDAPVAGTDDFNKSSISLYPNPISSMLNIITNEEIQSIVLYNSLGQQILQSNNKQIDLSAVRSGIYLLNTHLANGQSQTFKVIKK